MDKPTKPSNLIPRSFGGTKNNFSASLQSSGYEDGVPAIYGGDNLNYQLDATGKELDYCEKICDFINEMPIGKTIITDNNNKLQYTNLANVASSGDYDDLINKPTIPSIDNLANKDLSNLSATGQHVIDGQWVYSFNTIASGITAPTSDTTYSLSTFLPDDTYIYEVLFNGIVVSGNTTGKSNNLSISTDTGGVSYICEAITRTSGTNITVGTTILTVGSLRQVTIQGKAGNSGTTTLHISGYRRIGTNS